MQRPRTYALLLAATAITGLTTTASAIELIDDFDGSNGFATRTFTPDNTAFNGLFGSGGSRFDRFGIANKNTPDSAGPGSQGLPFDIIDETIAPAVGRIGAAPTDKMGIIRSTKNDNFVVLTDTVNNDNPDSFGRGQIDWTFDISGLSSVNLKVDLAALGVFEGEDADVFAFNAQIDSQPLQSDLIRAAAAPQVGGNNVAYSVTYEDGSSSDRFRDAFFNSGDWTNLTTNGPTATLLYATQDTNQDGLDNDAVGATGERIYSRVFSTFTATNRERNLYENPLVATTADAQSIQLDNTLQTVTVPISGVGNTLTLSFRGLTNGSQEYIVFDDVTIFDTIAEGIVGDYNNSGQVEQGDLDLVLQNWGDDTGVTGIPTGWINDNTNLGQIEQTELDRVLQNWGTQTAPDFAGSAVPEPATLALLSLGGLAMLRRRA